LNRLSLIRAILNKDFQDSLKKKTLLITLAAPVILSLFFRLATSPADRTFLKLAVVDRANSKFTEFLKKNSFGMITVKKLKNTEEAKKLTGAGYFHALVILPENFDGEIIQGRAPDLEMWVDSTNFTGAAALEVILSRMLYMFKGQPPPATIILKNIRGTQVGPESTLLPSWLLFSLLGTFMIVAMSIIEERERKTLSAILVSPCRLPDILIGKGMLGFLLTFSCALIILTLNKGFTGSIVLNLAIIILGTAFFSLLGVFLGLILPGSTAAQSAGSILYIGLLLPAITSDFNPSVKTFAKMLPSYYIYDGINTAMYSGGGAAKLAPHFIILAVSVAAAFTASLLALKYKENI